MYLKSIVTAVVGAALLTAGCGYTIKTNSDFNPGVQFSNYHTFYVMKGNSSGNSLLDQRAADDVKGALIAKGWTEAPEGQASAAVVVHAATKTKHTYQTFYDGWGGSWGWRRGWGRGLNSSTTYVQDYKVGTIVVDIFDAQSKQAIWRGSASDALSGNPSTNAKTTEQAVTKMFNAFPPMPRGTN